MCVTGLSGSGKSSLAFDTIYAEGQRRYVESLSAYARQFLQMMEKPDVDSIDGLSPAISIDQKTTARNPRSTVGTVTEIYDYLRLLYARARAAALPDLRPPDRAAVARPDRRAGAPLVRGAVRPINAPVVRDRKGESARVRGAAPRRLHARQGRRRAATARGGHRPRQEGQAHDRGRRRPARDEGRDLRPPAHASIETATSLAEGLVVIDVDRRPKTPRSARPRVPRSRRLARRARAAPLLVQLARSVPARDAGLGAQLEIDPDLHRPRPGPLDRRA